MLWKLGSRIKRQTFIRNSILPTLSSVLFISQALILRRVILGRARPLFPYHFAASPAG